jgi:hypothetical protein
MYVEDSDEQPKCVICGSEDECTHLVADIDRTFLECWGGAFNERETEFREAIETAFLKLLNSKNSRKWSHDDIEQMWRQACEDYITEGGDFTLDGYAFYRLVVELLVSAGAVDPPGQVIDDGGPGMTSSVSLLYADKPDNVTDKALNSLKALLNQHP